MKENGTHTAITAIEERRLQAWCLHCQGVKQTQIAFILGVTQGAVSRWLARVRTGGVRALRVGKPTGLPPRLPREKQELIPALLAYTPAVYGLAGDKWTRALVGELIFRQFGVRYSTENISYILRKVGWCGRPLQKPRKDRKNGVQKCTPEREAAQHRKGMPSLL